MGRSGTVESGYTTRPWLLTFRDRRVEEAFRRDRDAKDMVRIRVAVLLGIAINCVFIFLDMVYNPAAWTTLAWIRLGGVVPFLAVCLALSYTAFAARRVQAFGVFILLFSGCGHHVMAATVALPQAYILTCTLIVVIFIYTFAVLRFLACLATGVVILVAFNLSSYFLERAGWVDLLYYNYIMVSLNLMGLAASWTIDRSLRNEFAQGLVIEGEKRQLEERHRVMLEELGMARHIQLRLLPQASPWPQLAFLYRPMEQVGGDFVDFILFPDADRCGILVSDVSGHGVPAALITAMVKSAVQREAPGRESPAAVLSYLNGMLHGQTAGHFVTAFYGIYDRRTRALVYANAGHNPPFVVGRGLVRELRGEPAGAPLAVFDNADTARRGKEYRDHRAVFAPGEQVLLYTDGLTEAVAAIARSGAAAPDFGDTGLENALRTLHGTPAPAFVAGLHDRLVAFHGSTEFEDDVCLVCLDA